MNISQAFDYLDTNSEKYNKLFDNTNIQINESKSELDYCDYTITCIKTNKPLAKGNCSIIGLYNIETSIWYWGWGLLNYNKIETYMSRKLLLYALDMHINITTEEDAILQLAIKTELLSSKLLIKNLELELEKYLAIALYLTKSDYFYKVDIKDASDKIVAFVYYLLHTIN